MWQILRALDFLGKSCPSRWPAGGGLRLSLRGRLGLSLGSPWPLPIPQILLPAGFLALLIFNLQYKNNRIIDASAPEGPALFTNIFLRKHLEGLNLEF